MIFSRTALGPLNGQGPFVGALLLTNLKLSFHIAEAIRCLVFKVFFWHARLPPSCAGGGGGVDQGPCMS